MNFADMTLDQLRDVAEHGQQASAEISKRHQAEAEITEKRIKAITTGGFDQRFTDDELIYSATASCECGAGYAYPKHSGMHGRWICSSILKAEEKALPPTKHSGDLPFSMYDVKSEGQPSAHGKTTRPQNV